MIAAATEKAFAVLSYELEPWSVQALWLTRINRSAWPTVELRELSTVRCEEVPFQEVIGDRIPLLDRISFEDGRIHYGSRVETHMTQYRAAPGDIVVSKINARKRAIGLLEASHDIGITIHFRSMIPRLEAVVPRFLWLALRSEYCRRQFDIATGGIGKGEISEARLLSIMVPKPSIPIQQKIVDYWLNAETNCVSAYDELAKPVRALNRRLMDICSATSGSDIIHSRFFVLEFKDMLAWDAKSGRAASFRIACPSFRPMGDFVEDATELVRPADEPEKNWPVYGVNNKEGVFLNSHQKGASFNSPYKRIRKDWFFHNPTRCNVGSLGVVPSVPTDAITSPEYQVWRLKTGIPEPMLPGYVACLIQTPFFLNLVQFNRVGAVKQRMYTENLMQVRIPYLPLPEQQRYADTRAHALVKLAAAKARLDTAREEVEAMILGTKKVGAA